MRIMIVNTYYYPEIMGGAEYSVKKLAEQLQAMRHDVSVLCTGDSDSIEKVDGVEVIRFKPVNSCRGIHHKNYSKIRRGIRFFQDIWNPLNARKITKAVEDFRPDVIHTNGLYDITPIVWKIAKKQGIRVVHTLRDYHLMCPGATLSCGQNPDGCEKIKLLCRLHRDSHRKQSAFADCVTAPSRQTLEIITADGFFKEAQHCVIENATDFDVSAVQEIYKEREKKTDTIIKYVYLGNLNEQKGVLWMINTFKEIVNDKIRLIIAGKGPLEERVKKECELDNRIQFVGFLNEKGVDQLLKDCDVLICPSLWAEPFGRVVLDAYMHAMPVITSDSGALPELVDNGKTGFSIPAGDRQALAKAVAYYADNREERLHHGLAATELLQRFSLETQANRFLKIYRGEE